MKKVMNKFAAMEMSIGTIVVIVLAMSMLILGLVFVRNIMCSGIIITEQISAGAENEIKGLFNVDDYGVKCMGEAGEEVKLGDGGKRQIVCVVKTDETLDYDLKIKSIESIGGVKTNVVQDWIIDKDWKGKVAPGEQTVVVAVLDIPRNTDSTNLKITLEEKTAVNARTHTMYIDIQHVSGINAAVC